MVSGGSPDDLPWWPCGREECVDGAPPTWELTGDLLFYWAREYGSTLELADGDLCLNEAVETVDYYTACCPDTSYRSRLSAGTFSLGFYVFCGS